MDLRVFLLGTLFIIEKVCCFVIDFYCTFRDVINAFYEFEKLPFIPLFPSFLKKGHHAN